MPPRSFMDLKQLFRSLDPQTTPAFPSSAMPRAVDLAPARLWLMHSLLNTNLMRSRSDYCLSKTRVLFAFRPCAFFPFEVAAKVLPPLETVTPHLFSSLLTYVLKGACAADEPERAGWITLKQACNRRGTITPRYHAAPMSFKT